MRHKPLSLILAPLAGAVAVMSFPAAPTTATNLPTPPTAVPEIAVPTPVTEAITEHGTEDDILSTVDAARITAAASTAAAESPRVRHVPFFSQFADIDDAPWRKVACGVASLAMIIEYHRPGSTDANRELAAGIAAHAYTEQGWSHAGLIALAARHGLTGTSVSLADASPGDAFQALSEVVAKNPVMVSVHYTFDPDNPIPHLVIVTDIEGEYVYYNDPAEPTGGGFITRAQFTRAWKQRYIAFTPM